jgi:hypothetical protein|tara:strand:- start:959 stop:1408 length:450 start_codon:yes stop_codon:yes gene_type:complete
MLKIVDSELLDYIDDDPVRRHIPKNFRVTDNRTTFALCYGKNKEVDAMICCSFCEDVPQEENELDKSGNIAVFYTVWSYTRGAGTDIIFETVKWIQQNKPEVDRFVTLSPLTEMARKFHLRNGAIEYRMNKTSVNFEYMIEGKNARTLD